MARFADPAVLFRAEGGVLLALSVLLYWLNGGSWVLFGFLLFAPDLSLRHRFLRERRPYPPNVTTTSPTDGKRGVKRTTDLSVTFSEGVDRTSLSRSTFKLYKVNRDGTTQPRSRAYL